MITALQQAEQLLSSMTLDEKSSLTNGANRSKTFARGWEVSVQLQRQRELDVTREKLKLLEERFEANAREGGGDQHVRELSMRSLKRLINQLKEEIARFESRRVAT